MDNQHLHEMTKEAAKGAFKGKKSLPCKTVPRYPASAEREFRRVMNAYMKILNSELKKELPSIMKAYKAELGNDSRFDSFNDLEKKIRESFLIISKALEQKYFRFDLKRKLDAIAKRAKEITADEWYRTVKQTLGIDLMKDYYKGSFYEEGVKNWVGQNVQNIHTLPNQVLDDIRDTIIDGYRKGIHVKDLQKEIQHRYNISKETAQTIARDQMSTLNAQITQEQHRSAGVTRYKWSTSRDQRVRDCHRELDGKIISWDDPPEMWYMTKSRGKVYTGRRCHPGEDYCCRCVALPVFDEDTIILPMNGTDKR